MSDTDYRGAIAFAEKVLELLDEGRYTATYKFAVLLALIDLCLEQTQASGEPPQVLTTRQLAEKIVQLYWPHTLPFAGARPSAVLNQNTRGQAEIVSAIRRFRERHAGSPSDTWWLSKIAAPTKYEALVRTVEWKLIEMPLPRLQTMGDAQREFIYRIHWNQGVSLRNVRSYQDGHGRAFDNALLLKPGVGEYLVQLSGLLRPLIQRRWAAMVAQLNKLEESRLEEFLFGAQRTPTAGVRAGLWEIQNGRCFYCDGRVLSPVHAEVDHFVPWSRYPDDGLDNFVVADLKCNGQKSGSLAADQHVTRWAARFGAGSGEFGQFATLAAQTRWDRRPLQTLNVARAIYLRLPPDARLWVSSKEFIPPHMRRIRAALNVPETPTDT